MVEWYHQLIGLEFEQAPGDGKEQGRLVSCSPWVVSLFWLLQIVQLTLRVQVFFFFLIMVFSGYMPCSGIVGLYGNFFSLLRNLHDVLHSSYINLHSFQKFKRVTLSPHPCQHLLLADILMMAIRSSVRWHFISFLIWTV